MRELTYYVAVTLDGFIAAPDGDASAFPIEGDHMHAVLHDYTDAVPTHVQRAVGIQADRTRFDTVIMGWRTYTPALDVGIEHPYAHLRQIVATRSDRQVADGIEVTADPVAAVQRLKAEEGSGIYLAGGGELAGALVDEIDRLVLKHNPFALGAGIPLFAGLDGGVCRFTPVATREFRSGVRITEYVPQVP